jgi:hypothetical protein
MGGADDRSTSYYGGPQGPRCGPPSSAGSVGQGGSSRDFHYVTGPDHHFRSGSSSSRQSRNSSSTGSSNYHSPHVVPSSAGKNIFLKNYLKYRSEEKGSSLCKCSILLGFVMSKKLERLRSELLSEDKIKNLLGFSTK